MSKHAVMPLTDYVNVCDTLREKIGTTEPIKSGDIPKKVNDIYDMGKLATLKDSRYMNGKASGTIVSVNDVTPIEHNVGVKVASKNLFDISKLINTSNITNNQDGTLTIKANAVYSQLDSSNTLASLCPLLKVGDVATFSMITLSTYYNGMYLPTSKRMWQRGTALTITESDLNSRPVFYGFESSEENYGKENIISNIQIESGTTATPYTPYVADFTGVEVARYGKNLVNVADRTFTHYMNGYLSDYLEFSALRGKKIAYQFYVDFSNTIESTATAAIRVFFYDENKTLIKSVYGTQRDYTNGKSIGTINVPNTTKYVRLGAAVYFDGTRPSQANSSIVVKNIQLEIGKTATEYEPYTETVYTANADGTVEGVKSISPNMTLIPNNNAVTVECEYLRDIDLYIDNLITNVALTGGE